MALPSTPLPTAAPKPLNIWQRWMRQPQDIFLRRALFQIHLWAGIGVGLYIFMICVSGSVLVYRNELYSAFSPKPLMVEGSGTPKSLDELKAAAKRLYPDYQVTDARAGKTPNQAVEVTLLKGQDGRRRLFHPYTAEDLGDLLPVGYRITAWLLDLHDNLLTGRSGRRANGIGAVLLLLLCATGAVLWWPGIRNWRRSLWIDWKANWKRLNWTLHSALGLWFFGFVFIWGITGVYLCFPDLSAQFFDYLEPMDENHPVARVGDRIQYWLAYLHFGRLGGRGIPWCGRGLCNSVTKAVWAGAALVPAALFVTGALMWWNRSIRPGMLRRRG